MWNMITMMTMMIMMKMIIIHHNDDDDDDDGKDDDDDDDDYDDRHFGDQSMTFDFAKNMNSDFTVRNRHTIRFKHLSFKNYT